MKYDVAVIGGGPAGIMAAGRASELGPRVILLEKNSTLGKKLLITGGGRCNFTNYIIQPKTMADKMGHNGKFLISALHRFGPEDIIDFFNHRGVRTKIEANNMVFPTHNCSQDILTALIKYLEENSVIIKKNATVRRIIKKNNRITGAILTNGQQIWANNFIFCTGGKSYPTTGSTGDGYRWLKELGHTIIEPRPSLTPIVVQERFIKQLQGLSLQKIKIYLYQNKKKIYSEIGDIVFMSDGISGPAILNLSRNIREMANQYEVILDLKPEMDDNHLEQQLKNIFQTEGNKNVKNVLKKFLPLKIVLVILDLAQINLNQKVNSITREEKKKILILIKRFNFQVKGLKDYDWAMITSGGVSLKEINPKTMKSKLIENLYFAGEIVDLDGPTGGYNLQICWSTGYVAGESAVKHF